MDDEQAIELEIEGCDPSPPQYGVWERSPSGLLTRLMYDHAEDRLVIQRRQDVEPILEQNKALQNEPRAGWSKSGELLHVAMVPNVLVEKWFFEEGIRAWAEEDWPRVREKLNDPAYRHLRIHTGKL